MYAVLKTGGKQYKVSVGDKLKIEQIVEAVGDNVTFAEILMVANGDDIKVGTPLVNGATITASVVADGRHKKVSIFKMRRRKHYQKHQGHRQNYTEVRIDAINQ